MLAGVRSPSYHCVGMMIPGCPSSPGRNPHIAWGGTNMRAASSDFYDVSSIPPQQIESTTQTIKSRGWFDREVTIRRTAYGPILSDAGLIPTLPGDTLAIRWVGHEPTDDLPRFCGRTEQERWRSLHRRFAVTR